MRIARGYRILVLTLSASVLVAMVISLMVGQSFFGLADLLRAIPPADAEPTTIILWELRLPRTLLAVLVGASLGMCGAALQGLLRNPLAEPGIVGISGCAALGAVVVFYTGLSQALPLALPLGGIGGAVIAVGVLYLLAGWRGTTLSIILAGVAVNAFAGAMTALVLNLSPSPFALYEIIFWQMGSLADRSMTHVWLAAPLVTVGLLVVMGQGRALTALSLGEHSAASLGVRLVRVRALVIFGTALAVGSAVAVSGIIGFVGLVVPHLLRPLVGFHPGRLLVASGLGGASMVLLADAFVRALPTESELKLGVVTAILGAPFFLYLVYRLREDVE